MIVIQKNDLSIQKRIKQISRKYFIWNEIVITNKVSEYLFETVWTTIKVWMDPIFDTKNSIKTTLEDSTNRKKYEEGEH